MKTIMDRPGALPDRRETHRLLHQHLREVQHVPPPADFAVMPDLPHERPRGILDRRELRRIRPRRRLIHLAGGLSGQRLMRAFPILFLDKPRQPPLLRRQGRGRRPHRRFERPMHPLMTAILTRRARPNPFGPNAYPHPPRRPPARPPTAVDAKGGPVSVRIVVGSPYS